MCWNEFAIKRSGSVVHCLQMYSYGEGLQGFEPCGEIADHQEAVQMCFEVVMRSIVIPFHGGVLDGPVHSFHLSVRPGVLGFCQPVFDAMPVAGSTEQMAHLLRRRAIAVARRMTELTAVVSQDRGDRVRNGSNQAL